MLKIAGNDEMSLSNDCACGGCPFPLSSFFQRPDSCFKLQVGQDSLVHVWLNRIKVSRL